MSGHQTVVVVGAGLAGLAAAGELSRHGSHVVVLEARGRVGGRCCTSEGVDLGAHWIHGTDGNPITALARRHGLPTVFVGGDSTFTGGWDMLEMHGPGMTTLDDDEKLASMFAADAMWDALEVVRRRTHGLGLADVSLRGAVAALQADGQLPYDPLTLDWHLELLARDDMGCGSDRLSLLSWDDGVDVYGHGDSILVAGYQALAEAMAKGIDVRLNTAVRSIDIRESARAMVETSGETFDADAVLVTIPLGVLKAGGIEFEPPLPARKVTAIERLGVGLLAKVVLRFDRVWWRQDQYVTGVSRAPVSEWPTVIINMAATHHQPVLVLLAGGELGARLESGDLAEAGAWAMGVLREVFGSYLPEPVSVSRTEWSRDPWSLGSYTAMIVGSSTDDIVALGEPIGERLYFAGEATSEGGRSTAHGAVISGLREAARIAGDPSINADRYNAESRRWRRQQQRVIRFHGSMRRRLDSKKLADRLQLLRLNEAFDEVPLRDLETLASMFDERSLMAGEALCHVGDTAAEMFMIAQGEVSVAIPGAKWCSMMVRGETIGELALFTGGERNADVIAVSPCDLLVLDYDRFHRFLLAFPESALALLGASISRLTTTQRPS
jgi:monoamine oxidase